MDFLSLINQRKGEVMIKQLEVKVPASTANLGPGFDSIGMAFELYLTLRISEAQQTRISYAGLGSDEVPLNEDNLIYKTMACLYERVGQRMPPLLMEVENNIPLTRGLGSSASAIVAGLTAANKLLADPFSTQELYRMATEMEGHPDNVGASFFGNIVVAAWDGENVEHLCVRPPEALRVIAIIPEFTLSTDKARKALPDRYAGKDVVFNISRSALLVASLVTGDLEKLTTALKDRIHQPYRTAFIPGMQEIIAGITNQGAYGAVLSGAGPTLLALCHRDRVSSIKPYLQDFFSRQPYSFELRELNIDHRGVTVNMFDQARV